MKIKELKKNARQGLIAIILLFLMLTLAGLYWSLTRPAEVTEKFTAFAYEQDAELTYCVNLQTNELFEERTLEPGRAYLTALTDTVHTSFIYRFTIEQEAELRGDYEVVASIKALTGKEDHLVWERNYTLHPKRYFSEHGKEFVIREEVVLPYAEYAAFAQATMDETGFIPDRLNLVVDYDVALTADTSEGVIEERAAPQLIIPLRGSVFTVGGYHEEISNGDIAAVRQIAVPYYEETQIAFTLLTSILMLLLVALMQMTVAREEKNIMIKQKLARIFKKYQDRVVKCSEEIPIPDLHQVLVVSSFDDMVKTADELQKPILHYQAKDGGEHYFCIISEQYLYRYILGVSSSLFQKPIASGQLAKRFR